MSAMGVTTDPNDPRLGRGVDEKPVPQSEVYLVLSEEERAKGYLRPVRNCYIHVGPPGPKHPLRDLTPEEKERYAHIGYVKFEPYGDETSPITGRYWTEKQLKEVATGCNTRTTMGRQLAETYAADPTFYGSTYCVTCQKHRPVNEFKWLDGTRVGD